MPEYNNLEATDTMVVNSGENSYSVTVADVADGAVLEDTDLFLVNRGENSYSITKKQLAEEIAPDGVITPPVVVRTPPNGAGMADGEVTPAAEGITGLVESTVIAPTYSSTLTVEVGNADGGTTAVNAFDGDTAKEFRGTIASTMVWDASSYGITVANSLKIHTLSLKGSGDSNVAISINGAVLHNTNTSDQNTNYGTAGTVNIPFTGDLNEVRFVATGSAGTYFYAIYVDDEVLIDGGVTNNATLTYTTDNNLNLLTVGQAMTQQPAYTPVTDTISAVSGSAPNVQLTFNSPKDIVNFRPGDVVQGGEITTGLTFTLSGGASSSTNFYIGNVENEGKLLVDSEYFTDVNTQINAGTASDDGTRYSTNWANGETDASPNQKNGTGWRPIGNSLTASIDWTNPVNLTKIRMLIHHGDGENKSYTCEVKLKNGTTLGSFTITGGTDWTYITVDTNFDVYSVVSTDADNSKMTVDGGTWANGNTITGSTWQGTGEYVSHTANTLELTNAGGRWVVSPDVAAESDDIYTDAAPGWDSTTFQSGNGPDSSIEFDGESCVLREVKWTIEESSGDQSGPWENTTEYTDFVSVEVNQDVPPLDQEVTLTPGKFHRVKVQYTADSGADPVESDWNVFKASEDEKPQGVRMSGLRFDGARATSLNTTLAAGDVSKWTFSCWIKPTSFAEPNVILNAGGTNAGAASIMVLADGKVQFESDSATQIVSSTALSLNNWSHIVVSFDNGNASLSINELNETASSKTSTKINSSINHIIGRQLSRWNVNGYMSDVYFVDGQALESSAFGKDYAGLWGPIPSETILNNITRLKSPYDSRPNMDEDWSSYAVSNGLEPWTKAFDGVVNDAFNTNEATSNTNATPVVWTKTGDAIPFNTLEVWSRRDYRDPGETGKISINGLDVTDQITPNAPAWYSIDLTGATNSTSLESISMWTTYGSGSMRLGGVRIDGRLLIDGPADNSQVWSDGTVTGVDAGSSIELAFDGSTSTLAAPVGVSNGELSVKFQNSITANTSVEFYVGLGGGNLRGAGAVGSDGTKDYTFPAATAAQQWVTLPVTSFPYTFNQVWCSRDGSGQGGGLGAVRVDGKILIDAGAQWDTSQVWSEGASGGINRPGFDPSNAFDGDLTTFFNSDDTESAVFSFTNLTIQSSLRLFCRGANGNLAVTLSGVQQPITTDSGDAQWRSASVTGPVDFTSIDIAGSQIGLYAVEVDGKILVDAGSFGSNGFYLPFDPAQEGANYSSKLSLRNGATYVANQGPELAFNGSMVDSLGANLSTAIVQSGNSDLQLTFDTAINIGANSSCFMGATSGGSLLQFFNESDTNVGADISIPGGAGTLVTIPPRSDVKYIKWASNGATGDGVGFGYLIINSTLLVDYNNIGVDASGNDNHFQDQNFAVGNTSQVWRDYSTGNAMSNVANAFDGSTSTNASISGPVGVVVPPVIFDGWNISDVTKVRVYGYHTATNKNGIQVNDLDVVSNIVGWTDVYSGPAITFDKLTISSLAAGNSLILFAVEVNGQILIDANIQDTVVDTPVKNYAVLSTGKNGNLESTANMTSSKGTVEFTPGEVYYFEATSQAAGPGVGLADGSGGYASWDGSGGTDNLTITSGSTESFTEGDVIGVAGNAASIKYFKNGVFVFEATPTTLTGGVSFTSGGGSTAANFGQQLFVHGDHDLEAGTVVIDGVTYSTLYEELEGYQVAGGYFYDEKNQEPVRGSDLRKRFGITSADPQLGIYDLTEVPSHQVIGYEKVGSKYQALRDYTPEVRVAQAETTAVTAELTEAQATITAQRQMIIRAACTWVVGKAYEEGDIILFNGHVFKALTATTATADNDPGDETGDWEFLGLEEDTAPTVIDGYYPLYTTEAASNAAGNGSSHTHTFDGVTYYMPNGGTTIYHGTYTGYSY